MTDPKEASDSARRLDTTPAAGTADRRDPDDASDTRERVGRASAASGHGPWGVSNPVDLDVGRTLVYVLSTGRSGSTLLDLVLATHPGLTTVGELQLLPFDIADPAATCGCGRPYATCAFWAHLLDDPALAGPSYPLDAVRETRDAGRLLRPRLLPSLLTGAATASVRAEARAYGAANQAALRAVARRAGGTTLIDSSKDPYRLFLLARSGRFDLQVLHLVRDPRAVAFSFLGPGAASSARAIRVAGRWAIQQILFSRLARTVIPPGQTTVVRYEDLAVDPPATVMAIGARLGLDPDAFDPTGFRDYVNHAVAGNPMRERSDPITLDDRWRRQLDPSTARLVWSITAPVASALGYTRQSDRPLPTG